jgi:hypothetical protein
MREKKFLVTLNRTGKTALKAKPHTLLNPHTFDCALGKSMGDVPFLLSNSKKDNIFPHASHFQTRYPRGFFLVPTLRVVTQ